jgi:lysophospholipase L1-like esterase
VPTAASAAESNGGVKIMPLGDSITDGYNVPGGYRNWLWQHFYNDSYHVDFVGSGSNGPGTLGDRDHEGHSSYFISQIDSNIDTWLASNPRTVLLHIGTNDVAWDVDVAQAPARLGALIDKILAGAPSADVFVATIIPMSDAEDEAKGQTYNAAIPGIVQSKGNRVHLVDMHSALTTADLADGVHPNASGHEKMADAWYAAMKQVEGSLGRTPLIGAPVNLRIGGIDRCLDVQGASTAALAKTVVSGCGSGSSQQWTRTADDQLQVYGSSCLDVYGAATAAGSNVVIYPCHSGQNQKWFFLDDGRIWNYLSGRCLTGKNASTAQGTELVLADCAITPSQIWAS